MSKLLLSLFCMCLFFSAGYSQTKAEWKEFSPESGRFKIDFPAAPQSSIKDVIGSDGTVKQHQFDAETNGIFMAITYSDFPAYSPEQDEQQLKRSYDTIRDLMRQAATAATFIGEKDIQYDGKSGREVTFNMNGYTVQYRMLFVGIRMYQPMVSYKTTLKDDAATRQQISRFFDSFKVTDK